jgi:signal peptidase II
MRSTPSFVIATVGGAVADIVSKWIVFSRLDVFEKVTLIPGLLDIVQSTNEGVVFGLLPGKVNIFIVFSIIAIIAILCIHIFSDKNFFLSSVALGLILAGAIGNLWDRIWYGFVRDFIDLHIGDTYHWPTFNIADSLICIGISVMVFTSFFPSKSKESA